MTTSHPLLPAFLVVLAGILWGLYWLPVRLLDTAGLPGAWGTLALILGGLVALAPFTWHSRAALRRADPVLLASAALGGFAFALYSVGLLYGRVAVIVILFYLTPVWSTLITRLALGWPTPRLRLAALGIGLGGMALVLGADGTWPVPRSLGEALGLASGVFWAIATIGLRLRPSPGPANTAFVFAAGAGLGVLVIAPILGPPPPALVWQDAAILAALAGAIWWGATIAGLMWAAPRLDPARVGMLLMAEVPVAALSAAWWAGETLHAVEWAGGALVVLAAVLELWPDRALP